MSRGVPVDVARRLIEAQFPHLADLPLRTVPLDGWDNTTFRLGEHLSVRLPNEDAYAAQVEKEHSWLPRLQDGLPLAIPQPVEIGRPTPEFPRPWSIRRWIDGVPAAAATDVNMSALAVRLAGFLRALYSIDASEGSCGRSSQLLPWRALGRLRRTYPPSATSRTPISELQIRAGRGRQLAFG